MAMAMATVEALFGRLEVDRAETKHGTDSQGQVVVVVFAVVTQNCIRGAVQ